MKRLLVPTLVLLAGCSLVPGPPPTIRWFTALPDIPTTNRPTPTDAPSLRLRRVTAARHLTERMAWRDGGEFGFAELERWTEEPGAVLERALEVALFESGELRRDGRAEHVLDVAVRAFEHDRASGEAVVRVGVQVLGPGDRGVVDTTLEARRAAASDAPADIAAATRAAVGEVVEKIAAAARQGAGGQ